MEDNNNQEVMDSLRSRRNYYFERTLLKLRDNYSMITACIVKYHHLIIFDKLFYEAYEEIANN